MTRYAIRKDCMTSHKDVCLVGWLAIECSLIEEVSILSLQLIIVFEGGKGAGGEKPITHHAYYSLKNHVSRRIFSINHVFGKN